jgi:cation diffusion facilitator CzcD-associated flavoprotein CzcO
MRKRVAIIGGGLTGIGCLTELVSAGHDARLYERNDDIGGVWHPANCYSGLSLHGASAAFEYHDFPLPASVDTARPISSPEVHEYLKAYFAHKGHYDRAEFDTEVEAISYSGTSRTYTLRLRKRGAADVSTRDFDYVVYTHGFTARNLPAIDGACSFAGQALHSYDLSESKLVELVGAGRKVVLVGGSKTATDLILRFHHHQHEVKWLCRKNYWFLRSDPLINIVAGRMSGKSWGGYRRVALFIGDIAGSKLPRVQLAILRACGLADTFGARHWDFTKFHRGRIEDASMSKLRTYFREHGVVGEIASFAKDGLKLEDGRKLACDAVIFCTGSSPHRSLLPIAYDGVPFDLGRVARMYRERVIPELSGLIFTAFHFFSFGVVNGLMTGRWVVRFIQEQFDESYLADHARTYDPPFFLQPSLLFDSSRPMSVRSAEMLAAFFRSGEISKSAYSKWLWEFTSAPRGVEPLTIHAPARLK